MIRAGVGLLLTAAMTAAQVDAPKLEGWTYRVDARPLSPEWVDPGGRLNDGKAGRGGGVAIWSGGDIHVTIDLGGTVSLSQVKVHQHRHNLNYKLDHLSVMIERAGQFEEAGRVDGFFGPTPTMDFVHEVDLKGVETARIRLDFFGCNALSLSEIELYGKRARQAAAGGLFAELPLGGAEPAAREADLDRDGQPELILENRHVRLIFTPAKGGVCRSLRLKPEGTELVHAATGGYGLLRDQLWKPNYSFGDRFYFHRLTNDKDLAAVELWTTGVGGMMSFTEVRKRITLRRDSSLIEVHYALANEPSSQTDYEYGFWSHNWLGSPAGTNTYQHPTTDGVQRFTLDAEGAKESRDLWYRNPARGWTAVSTDSGAGLALAVPFKYLNLYYTWNGKGAVCATHEWRFNLIELKAGEKLEFDATLVPFRGLPTVDGVVAGVVGRIVGAAEGNALKVEAQAEAPAGATGRALRLTVVTADGKPVGQPAEVALTPGRVASAKLTAPTPAAGTYTARAEVLVDGQPAGSFERPFAVGGARLAYHLDPEGKQVGRKEEATAKPAYRIRTDVVTPHIKWAKPLPGGPIKALVLCDDMNSREAVELAQRIDLDLDYTKFRTTFDKEFLYQGDLSVLTLDAAQKRLSDKLKAGRYDVILAAGFNWRHHFSAENRELMLGQVREGTGLILIQPDGFAAEDLAELPVAGVAKEKSAARSMWGWHNWQPAGEHPLVAGLDWSRFPVTRRHEYATRPEGEVVATIGKDAAPLLVLGKLGRGRLLGATWDTLTHDMSYRGYSALTPILSYRGEYLRPEFYALPTGYHEHWFALLCRMVAWAAGRDGDVTLATAEPRSVPLGRRDAKLALAVTSGHDEPGATAEVRWMTPAGVDDRPVRVPAPLKRGKNAVEVPLGALPGGIDTAAVTIRKADGSALAWGTASVTVEVPARQTDLTVTPDRLLPAGGVWQEDGPVETPAFEVESPLQVAAKLDAAAPAGLTWRLRVTDSRGRLLAQRDLTVAAGTQELSTSIALPTLIDQGVEVTARLCRGDDLLDQRRARVVAFHPRVWNRFWFTSWNGNWLWRSYYLFDANRRIVRDWGLDSAMYGEVELGTGKVRDDSFYGINHTWLGLLLGLGKGVLSVNDVDFAKKAAAYAKTKDKQQLQRTPCLVDPVWREAVKAKLLDRVNATMPPGAMDYCMGDEMSLTDYTRYFDYDWSPASLADFRTWLQQRYRGVADLNKSWGTDFQTFDQVLPLTLDEAVKVANPAPWAEFRLYMNDQIAGFYRFVQDTIRSVDPNAKCGLSGTQSPEAGNGMDWFLLSDAFSYYHSYNTSWSNEMRRSFHRRGGADQSPYNGGYSAVNPDAEYRLWWCLFHDTRGISAWTTSLFFNGDLTESQSGADTKAHLETFRRGLWRLVRAGTRQHDGIALYYSMPTIIAGALMNEEKNINAYRDAWVKLLEDAGLQYEFVAAPEVERGLLDDGEFKVVVLPYTLALSRGEVAALKRFVERGGTILASRRCGVRDELCRPQSPALLDDLFGVREEGEQKAVEPVIKLTAACGGLAAGEIIRTPVGASNLKLTGGQALATSADGAAPALIRGPGGRAVLLNLDLANFEAERRFRSPTEKQVKALIGQLLADAGVRPKYPATLQSGAAPQLEMARYKLDGIELLCLLNADDKPNVATIALGGEKQVYDLRAESDRGRLNSLQVPLEPKCARVYALCDGPFPAPTLRAAGEVARAAGTGDAAVPGRLALTVGRAAAAPTRQLVRLTVATPDGTVHPEQQQTVWVTGGPVETSLPLALDSPTGNWTITATDVLTGQSARATVAVR